MWYYPPHSVVSTSSASLKRGILLIFSFLSVQDVLPACLLLTKAFSLLVLCEELWADLLTRDFPAEQDRRIRPFSPDSYKFLVYSRRKYEVQPRPKEVNIAIIRFPSAAASHLRIETRMPVLDAQVSLVYPNTLLLCGGKDFDTLRACKSVYSINFSRKGELLQLENTVLSTCIPAFTSSQVNTRELSPTARSTPQRRGSGPPCLPCATATVSLLSPGTEEACSSLTVSSQ